MKLTVIVIWLKVDFDTVFGMKNLPGHHLNIRFSGVENNVPSFINDKTNVHVPLKGR